MYLLLICSLHDARHAGQVFEGTVGYGMFNEFDYSLVRDQVPAVLGARGDREGHGRGACVGAKKRDRGSRGELGRVF